MDPDETRRRIVAARLLLDIDQDEMSARGHTAGLGKHELARVERGSLGIQRQHLLVLSEVLEVPLGWFSEPREAIVNQRPVEGSRLAAMEDSISKILEHWEDDLAPVLDVIHEIAEQQRSVLTTATASPAKARRRRT